MTLYLASSSQGTGPAQVKKLGHLLASEGYACLHWWANLPQGVPYSEADETAIWRKCIGQITRADAVVVIAPDDGKALRGAIWEAGYAIARGIPVFILDPHDEIGGTWQFAPETFIVRSVEELIQALGEWAK